MPRLAILRFPLLATALVACAEDLDVLSPVPSPAVHAADVERTYVDLDNACNDGYFTRTLTAVSATSAEQLWSTPSDDPAGQRSPKHVAGGWRPLVAVAKVTFDGVAEQLLTTSEQQAARCDAARDIVTPITRDGRRYFTNLLVFAGEHPHLDVLPSRGSDLGAVDAPVRLRGYLQVASGIRVEDDLGVLYRDVVQQHIPIAIACTRPLRVVRELAWVTSNQARGIDAATCEPLENGASCIVERAEHPSDNRCTLVATGAAYTAPDGRAYRLSLGARAATTDGVTYSFTVDRFEFHAP